MKQASPSKVVILVDMENIIPDFSIVPKTALIHLGIGVSQSKRGLLLKQELRDAGFNVQSHQMHRGGKNSLDATLHFLAADFIAQGYTHIFFVSQDKGFDIICEFAANRANCLRVTHPLQILQALQAEPEAQEQFYFVVERITGTEPKLRPKRFEALYRWINQLLKDTELTRSVLKGLIEYGLLRSQDNRIFYKM